MSLFIYQLKGLCTVLNIILILLVIAYLLYKYKKEKTATAIFFISFIIFLLSSTAYLPRYLAVHLENKFLPFNISMVKNAEERYYIHILGSGNNLDSRLPANSQLGLAALSRLAEGIRLHRMLKKSIIVSSANSMLGLETQASVTKRAAIILGIDSNKVEKLDTPSTTKEEAFALREQYGNNIKLIIVSDAMHLPRAMELFKKEGFNPVAAPTNYKAPIGPKGLGFDWWPSTVNINLMDIVLHEYFGKIKSFF